MRDVLHRLLLNLLRLDFLDCFFRLKLLCHLNEIFLVFSQVLLANLRIEYRLLLDLLQSLIELLEPESD